MWSSLKEQAVSPIPERYVSDINVLLAHFLVCGIGLQRACMFLAHVIYAPLSSQIYIPYNDWAYFFLARNKPLELLGFGIFLVAAFLYFALAYFCLIYRNGKIARHFASLLRARSIHLVIYLVTMFLVNGLTGFSTNNRFWIFIGIPWVTLVLFPIGYTSWSRMESWEKSLARHSWRPLWAVLLALVSIQLFSMFTPFLRGRLQMLNEFIDIPEQTKINGRYVENTAYINEHRIGGLLKYDPEIDQGNSPAPLPGTFAKLPKTQALMNFINDQNQQSPSDVGTTTGGSVRGTPALLEQEKRGTKPVINGVETSYYYNDAYQALVINRAMTIEEMRRLQAFSDPKDRPIIQQLFFTSNLNDNTLSKNAYSPEEVDFIKKNRFELECQILNRWVVHHHNFVLSPINEYALGKPLNEINMQYGFFNIILMKHLLEETGGITYQNYFRIWYAFWPIYYAFFILICFLLLKDIRYVLSTCLATFAGIQMITYKFLLLGPGLNPQRHFFDIGAVYLFYLYMNRRRAIYFAAMCLLMLLALVNNTQFGLFLLGAAFAALVIRSICRKEPLSRFEIGGILLTLVGMVLVYWKVPLGTDYMLHYYLAGFASFPIHSFVIFGIILFFTFITFFIIWHYDKKSDLQDTVLFLALYSEAATLYWVWGATINHFYNLTPIFALSTLVLIKWFIDSSGLRRYAHAIGSQLILFLLLFMYIPSLTVYYVSRHSYQKIFKTHKVYEWNLDRARFQSTAAPDFFQNSVKLIRKYSESQNGIYIISKYDNFLPFLSSKYSAMPFFDVPWFVVSAKEIQMCIESIKSAKPEYLFVDRDIGRSLNGEIVNPLDPMLSLLYDEAVMRVQRLNSVKQIYQAVRTDYTPVDHSELLMVLKRKTRVPA